ncbi:hypothetical protein D3C72_1063750 [compost metagenome]
MKLGVFLFGMLLSVSTFAREPKATVCYHEARVYAQALVGNGMVSKGKLELFSDVSGVQLEGWSFTTLDGKTIVIVASADGDAPDKCRLNLTYSK